jgi:general secretion pathway protein A
MYEAFYGFKEPPFNLTPDPRFLFMTRDQREALAYLTYGIQERKGFLVLSGEVGVGKTLLVRALLESLDESVESALVMNAMLTFNQLLRMALVDFGLRSTGRDKVDMLLILQRYLLELQEEGRNALIIVDEAQNLSPASLEEFRLLSNLETSTRKLLQIVLVGQPELTETLNSHRLRQLRQRIPGMCELHALAPAGVGEYIQHRVRVASEGRAGGVFSDEAIREVALCSRGVPRTINLLCDRALLISYVLDRQQVDAECVTKAITEIERGFEPVRRSAEPSTMGSRV